VKEHGAWGRPRVKRLTVAYQCVLNGSMDLWVAYFEKEAKG
jgi:hypothetical protein